MKYPVWAKNGSVFLQLHSEVLVGLLGAPPPCQYSVLSSISRNGFFTAELTSYLIMSLVDHGSAAHVTGKSLIPWRRVVTGSCRGARAPRARKVGPLKLHRLLRSPCTFAKSSRKGISY
jgi:hypothetical protein